MESTWTDAGPTASGYYWWRYESGCESFVARVTIAGVVRFTHGLYVVSPNHPCGPARVSWSSAEDLGGQWHGLIAPPEG